MTLIRRIRRWWRVPVLVVVSYGDRRLKPSTARRLQLEVAEALGDYNLGRFEVLILHGGAQLRVVTVPGGAEVHDLAAELAGPPPELGRHPAGPPESWTDVDGTDPRRDVHPHGPENVLVDDFGRVTPARGGIVDP